MNPITIDLDRLVSTAPQRTMQEAAVLAENYLQGYVEGAADENGVADFLINYTAAYESAIEELTVDPVFGVALLTRLCAILGLLRAETPEPVWQPASELPKIDGARVFVFTPDNPTSDTWPAVWSAENENFVAGSGWFERDEITAWMYAPDIPPKTA